MASQGQAMSSEHQAFRVTDPSICTTCGIEWFSTQNLHRKINILQNQHSILNDQLFRTGHINQLNELRIRTLNHEREGYAALAESSKQAAAGLQRHLDNQQATFEAERKERALALQSLEYESARREAAERCIEHERATVQKLTGILDKLELPNGEELGIDLPDDVGLGTLFHEWESMKSETKSLRNELKRTSDKLQQKKHVLQNMSGDFEIQSQSMSETSFSGSDEESNAEVAEMQTISAAEGKLARIG
ncbi:MAG: hypothetical protein Q9217_004007 [Psora testacea]